MTDYEGLGTPGVSPYLIGRSEGRAMLDIVIAARQFDPRLSDRVLISGHSQGAQSALWAAALAPSYTPKLNLRGTLPFAPPTHLAEQIAVLRRLPVSSFTGTLSLILRGASVDDPALDVPSLLTPAAAQLYPQTLTRCLAQLKRSSSFGALTGADMFAPAANLAPLRAVLGRNDPDGLMIRGPILLEQGLKDTTVLPATDLALSQSLRKVGDDVTYQTWPTATHQTVTELAAKAATAFVRRRLGPG